MKEPIQTTSKYSVLTKNGFKKFDGVKRSVHSVSLIFKFDDYTIINVTHGHLFETPDGFREAKTLKINDRISEKVIISIEEIHQKREFFDLLNVDDGNHYVTSGVTSHNCAYIRPSVWEEFADSIFASQSALAWKKNVILSTPRGMNHFYTMVKGAKAGTNGMKLFEVDWRDVPRYDVNGNLISNEEFKEKIIKKYGPVYFAQNYSCEFHGSSHTLVSSDKILTMTPKTPLEKRDGMLRVYERPKNGHKYIMTVDAAKDGSDSFGVQVVDITDFNFIQVASAKLQVDYLKMPAFLDEWGRDYNNAYMIIENNEGAGQSIADQLKQSYEYENIHHDNKIDTNTKNRMKSRKAYPGFRTTTKSRKQILQTLKLFIDNDKLHLNDADTIAEFSSFILVGSRYEADEGTHDDMIMSLAMVFVPFCDVKNFDDMKKVVVGLYENDNLPEEERVDFSEMLIISSFDDGTDEEFFSSQSRQWNGYDVTEEY